MQKFQVYCPPQSLKHRLFPVFSEKPERLEGLRLLFEKLHISVVEPSQASLLSVAKAHSFSYIEHIEKLSGQNIVRATIANLRSPYLQWYTRAGKGTYEAALYAAGAVCEAVQGTLDKKHQRSFCAVRPPGHHAGIKRGEGFCFFINVAIGALHALTLGAKRVAIIDFDRHHGNGTQEIVEKYGDGRILFVSSFQVGCEYSHVQSSSENIVQVPIPEHSNWNIVGKLYLEKVLPPLQTFKPDLILLSAGFDMHVSDPLTNLKLESADYFSLTRILTHVANALCGGRIVSVLEGGYELRALQECVTYHIDALQK